MLPPSVTATRKQRQAFPKPEAAATVALVVRRKDATGSPDLDQGFAYFWSGDQPNRPTN